jgi:hypothetical protein
MAKHYNVGDKVNMFIAFENENNKWSVENCFYVENVTILERCEHCNNSYYYRIDDINNIKPSSVCDGSFIPKAGYQLYFNPQRDVEFASAYGAVFVVCKSDNDYCVNCKKLYKINCLVI